MLVDIAAIPVDEVLQEAIRLNRQLDQLGDNDILIGGDGIPHVSLLIIDVDAGRIDELKLAILRSLNVQKEKLGYGSITQDEPSLRVFWNASGPAWKTYASGKSSPRRGIP